MRIWSLHPSLLDTKGLVALWRETLLAKNVLEGKTNGYKNHPQLLRFKEVDEPLKYINEYLYQVLLEARIRGYNFDAKKCTHFELKPIPVTRGQVEFEFKHLTNKLQERDPAKYSSITHEKHINVHPLFKEIEGEIEEWERI